MNHLELAKEVAALSGQIVGGRIQRVFVASSHDLVFDIRVPGRSLWLLVSLHPVLPRIHEIPQKPEVPQAPPPFCMSLRKHLVGRKITDLEVIESERILLLKTENAEGATMLITEFFGPFGNAFVTGEDDLILDVFFPKKAFSRKLKTGAVYKSPPLMSIWQNTETIRDFGPDIAAYFDDVQVRLEFDSAKRQLESSLLKKIKRSEKYVNKLKNDFGKLESPDRLRKYGELLSIHLKQVRKGMDVIVVPDIFLQNSPNLEIPLDPKKDGPRNLEAFFKRAKRNKRKINGLAQRIDQVENLLLGYYECREEIKSAETLDQLLVVRERYPDLELNKQKQRASKTGRAKPAGPLEFISADNYKILVGRNDKQNDQITFSVAKGNDYWLHVLGWPGSHVVILLDKSGELKQETLLDAATLAILHSKLVNEKAGEVVYTRRKYVHKPKGMSPGKVTHSQAKTLFIRIDKQRVDRLMNSRERQ